MSKSTKHPGWRTESPIRAQTHPDGGIAPKGEHSIVHHSRNRPGVVEVIRGTGKGGYGIGSSPEHTHKPGGAIMTPRKAKGRLDSRF